MKRIATISVWLILFAGLIVLVGFVEQEHKKITCKSVEVIVDYKGSDPLINAAIIKKNIGYSLDTLVGKRISEINLTQLEEVVQQNEIVESAQVYSTLTGHLKIKVTQKQPLIRVINNKSQSYYIDLSGKAMPVQHGFSSRLLVASGHIPYSYSDTLDLIKNENFPILNEIHQLALYIHSNDFLHALVEQIYVNQEHEYELIPKVGKHIIVFGGINDMELKFEKLIVFYQNGISRAGWDAYKSINLKFKDQVVCAKN